MPWRCAWLSSRPCSSLRLRGRRDESLDEVLRALVEGARAASRPASRAIRPSCGIGRVRGDAGELERAAVDPGVVPVLVGQEHRPIGDDPVEILPARQPAREVGEIPAAAEDPRRVRVGRGVGRDALQVLVEPARVVQVALEVLDARRDRVDVGVPEARRDRAAAERRRRGCAGPASGITSRSPPTATIRPPRTATACAQLDGGVGGEHAAAGEDEVGGVGRGCRAHGAEDARGGTTRARRVSPCGLTATLRP